MTLLSGTCRTLATTSGGTPRPHIITAAALQISSTLLASFRASPSLRHSALLTASLRLSESVPCYSDAFRREFRLCFAISALRNSVALPCFALQLRDWSVPFRSASRHGRALLIFCSSLPCHATLIQSASNPRLAYLFPCSAAPGYSPLFHG